MGPPGARHRAWHAHVGGRSFLLLILVVIVLAVGAAPAQSFGPARSATLSRVLTAATENCSSSMLALLTATPTKVAVAPLDVQVFAANAESACGTPLTDNVSITWWLSSVSLGTLSSTGGSTTTYTACIAPMDGVLHVKAVDGGLSLFANSTISVSLQSTSGSNPAPGAPTGATGDGEPSSSVPVPWGAVGIMGALLGTAAVVLVLGRRKRE
jgi:hypothetical protein